MVDNSLSEVPEKPKTGNRNCHPTPESRLFPNQSPPTGVAAEKRIFGRFAEIASNQNAQMRIEAIDPYPELTPGSTMMRPGSIVRRLVKKCLAVSVVVLTFLVAAPRAIPSDDEAQAAANAMVDRF